MRRRLPRPRSRRARIIAVLALVVLLLGLAGFGRRGGPTTAPSPRDVIARTVATPRASHPPTAGPAPALAGGASDAAPAAAGPQLVDATDGAVADATARAWGDAYLATVRWTVYAVEREQPEILQALYSPGEADPTTLRLIVDARADGAQLAYATAHEPHVTRLLLVALTPAQRAAVVAAGGHPAPAVAWVVTYSGPTDLTVRWPSGHLQTYSVLPAGEQATELSVGSVVDDPAVGTIWRETYSRDCTAHPDPVLCPY